MNANNTEIWVMFGHLICIIRRETYIDPEFYRLIWFLSDLKQGGCHHLLWSTFPVLIHQNTTSGSDTFTNQFFQQFIHDMNHKIPN